MLGPTFFSTDLRHRIFSHSGGLITLLIHLLDRGIVPFLLCVRAFVRGEADGDSGGSDNNALDVRAFGTRLNRVMR